MFCPKCGRGGQAPDSYCRQCGDWLPDLSSGARRGRFRRPSREDRVRRMRVLQFVSIGLSLASTLIIIHILVNGVDREMLPLAALCGFLVAVYQIITLILGTKVLNPKIERAPMDTQVLQEPSGSRPYLQAADTGQFIKPDSVVDDTTELLQPVPRSGRQKRN